MSRQAGVSSPLVVGGGEKRFADVKARECVALEKNDGTSALRQRDRRRSSRRPAAGDGEIEVVLPGMLLHFEKSIVVGYAVTATPLARIGNRARFQFPRPISRLRQRVR